MDPVQPQSSKMQALQQLQQQLPVASSRIAQGQQAAQNMQLQQAVQQAPQGGSTTGAAQQTGTALAQQSGQQAVGRAENQIQQQGQIANIAGQQQQQEGQAKVFGLQQGAEQQKMDNVQRLNNVDQRTKQQLFDQQLQFQKDESGRTLFNQRQLLDYAKVNAENNEQFKNTAQQMQQMQDMKMQAMEQSYKVIQQDLDQKAAIAQQNNDQEARLKIVAQKKQADLVMAHERGVAANHQAMMGAIASVPMIGGMAAAMGTAAEAPDASTSGNY